MHIFLFKNLNITFFFCFSLLCCSFHETEEDGSERFHSEACHKLLRLQAVSTIWLTLLSCIHWNPKHWETQPDMLVVCPLRRLNVTPRLADSYTSNYFWCFVIWWTKFELFLFFSPEVQSILNLSPPQDAELMNTNPSPPVSRCVLSFLYLHRTIYMQGCTHISLFTCLPYILWFTLWL